MLSAAYIAAATDQLIDKYKTRDPEELCSCLNIKIYRKDLEKKLKGFFVCFSRQSSIVIDSNVNSVMERILIAHELGHAVLHRDIAMMKGFAETELLSNIHPEENEANLFAAELLLEDEEVLEKLGYLSFFQAASALNVPAAFLDYKFLILKGKGYSLNTMDIRRSDILRQDLHAYDAYTE